MPRWEDGPNDPDSGYHCPSIGGPDVTPSPEWSALIEEYDALVERLSVEDPTDEELAIISARLAEIDSLRMGAL